VRIRTQILSVFIPLIVAPIIVLGTIALNQLQAVAKERLLTQLSAEADKVAAQSLLNIEATEKDLEILSTFSVVERYLMTEDDESRYTIVLPSLLKLFRTFQSTHTNYYEIKVLLSDGYEDARAALPAIDNVTDDESTSTVFEALQKDDTRSRVTRLVHSPDTNRLAITTAKRMSFIDRRSDPLSATPTTRGYLVITSDISDIEKLTKAARIGRSGLVFLADDEGTVVYHPKNSLIGTKLSSGYIAKLHAAEADKATRAVNDQGVEVYSAHATVFEKLHVVSEVDASEVLESGRALTEAVVVIVFVSVLVTAALAYYVLNRILIAPIGLLGNAVADLKYGAFQKKISISAGNELGQLARAFEDMGDKLQASHSRIHSLAYFDDLTKLPNRSMLKGELERTLSYSKRHNLKFALMFIDVDNFKRVNDLLGHHAGDQLLITVSERLKASLRGEDLVASANGGDHADMVARLGGDEFILLLPAISSPMAARTIAQRIIAALGKPIVIDGEEMFVGASIGISLFPEDGGDAELLLRNADLAMYEAKSSGKNRLQFFGEAINRATTVRLNLENRLRRAIQDNLLEIYYQPIVRLEDRRIIGAEALLRWNDEGRGFVPPDRFIAVAEESGLIIPLGEWVLHSACQQNQRWHASGLSNLFIAVNVSGVQIIRGDVDKVVQSALRATGLNARQLCIEVTETSVVGTIDRANKVLETLRQLDVRLALDDFGTGYSSLNYLRKLPVDRIKVDRSFVSDIGQNREAETIIAAIIAMGHNLSKEIVAEGIETGDQLQFLLDRHCEMGQGYLFSKPIPNAEFEHYARTSNGVAPGWSHDTP
jgi:diguanylate cyclase (GGDEF)-like protein